MNFLQKIVSAIVGFFKSGQAEAALTTAAQLVPKAIPIVEAIAAIAPNKTDTEIATAFAKYGQQFSTAWLTSGPVSQRGLLLLHLATSVLAEECPGVATNVLNSAVQFAVTGAKAS